MIFNNRFFYIFDNKIFILKSNWRMYRENKTNIERGVETIIKLVDELGD